MRCTLVAEEDCGGEAVYDDAGKRIDAEYCGGLDTLHLLRAHRCTTVTLREADTAHAALWPNCYHRAVRDGDDDCDMEWPATLDEAWLLPEGERKEPDVSGVRTGDSETVSADGGTETPREAAQGGPAGSVPAAAPGVAEDARRPEETDGAMRARDTALHLNGGTPLGYCEDLGTWNPSGDYEEGLAQGFAARYRVTGQIITPVWIELRQNLPFARAARVLTRALWLQEQGEPSTQWRPEAAEQEAARERSKQAAQP